MYLFDFLQTNQHSAELSSPTTTILPTSPQLPLLLLAIVSSLVLLVSLLGCLGSCQQSRCLVALVGRVVLMVALGVAVVVGTFVPNAMITCPSTSSVC